MDLPLLFLTLGCLFLAGLAADYVGRGTLLPRVTLLLACGLAVGQSGLDLLPDQAEVWYEFLSVAALTMVAFLLGGSLTKGNLAAHGKVILGISIGISLTTWAVVGVGLWLLGAPAELALLLGAIATATDPAATLDVMRQNGVENGFTRTLEGIVAIDDVWGLMIFSVALAFAHYFNGVGAVEVVFHALREIGGAVALGTLIGLPAAYLTGRISGGDPLRTEALGVVFLTAGLSIWAEVSFLIAGMTAGALIVNFARHHSRAFHEIEHIQWPFMILFFILAGASLEVGQLIELGLFGLAFVVLRTVSRIIGAFLGARSCGVPTSLAPLYGTALLPQAGVAVGMALIAAETFPGIGQSVLTLAIASTVVFELLGPFATLWSVRKVQRMEAEQTG